MTIRKEIDIYAPLTDRQRKMLETIKDRPIEFDEDCPALTKEQLTQLRRVSEERRAERCKQTVSIRLSPQALATAKSLGKGYTSILSRILENALKDIDTIRNNL